MTRRQAARWIEAYLAAWRSNAPADIESLFTPDAVYFTAPHRTPWQGQREIVQGWLGRADDQGDWDFRYEVLHVTDDTANVRGWTIYEDGVVCASNEVQVPGRREARSSGLDWGVK